MSTSRMMSKEDGYDFVRERIKSREWWVILIASEKSADMARAIEENFYTDGNNNRFEVVLGDFDRLPVAICFANKSEMSRQRLGEMVGIDVPEEKDFIATPDIPFKVLRWFIGTFGDGVA
jgi:hypothetical protein